MPGCELLNTIAWVTSLFNQKMWWSIQFILEDLWFFDWDQGQEQIIKEDGSLSSDVHWQFLMCSKIEQLVNIHAYMELLTLF